MKELKNIWQHVFRKRIHEVRDIEGHESFEEIHMLGNGMDLSDDGYLFSGDMVSGRKRKDVDDKQDDRACSDPSSAKKARVVWTVDLHQKFVKAVNLIGFDKVGPKKILDLMGVSWLTRENVASHLQKYRLYLSRLQKENEQKSGFGGIKHSDISPKDKDPSVSICNQINGTNENHGAPAFKLPMISDGNLTSTPMAEFMKSQFGDAIDPPKSSSSRISFSHSYGSVDSEAKSEPKFQVHYSWGVEVPSIQFKQERVPHSSSDKVTTKVESTSALFSVQPQSYFPDSHIPCTKNQQNLFDDLESSQKSFILGTGSAASNCLSPNIINFGSIESFGHDVIADIPAYLYDSLNFDCPSDLVEYHAIDQGVYIA